MFQIRNFERSWLLRAYAVPVKSPQQKRYAKGSVKSAMSQSKHRFLKMSKLGRSGSKAQQIVHSAVPNSSLTTCQTCRWNKRRSSDSSESFEIVPAGEETRFGGFSFLYKTSSSIFQPAKTVN